ncbi:hypothetical protein EPR50_G00133710 [Perca flavescens]|uniref:HTH psq-type domain-containing protein n=1 Tax=Perca flavescens TaxID=8167 RepID=A0A484CT82_PERFV|nr:hypothetical protein EPR50_G00133710 [Perca flavescens]
MPNIRQMRKRERKTKKWTQEAMDQAKQEVEAGRLSLRQAAMRFGVPKSSLSDRVSGRVASDFSICRRSLLTHADEDSLVEYSHLKAPVFQMNTVTSALISGVIILGVMSVCFFIFSLTLLKGKGTPVNTLSGLRNPAFN